MSSSAANPSNSVYDDFEPTFEWAKEDRADTLLLFLPGFRQQQIKVQTTSTGNLRVTGERQVGDNRWSRFRLEIPIKPNYDTNKITAKYENGILFVKHPKTIASVPAEPRKEAKPIVESSQPPKATAPAAPKATASAAPKEQKQKEMTEPPDVGNFAKANLSQKAETTTARDNTERKRDKKPHGSGDGARKKEELAPYYPCLSQIPKPTNYKHAIGDFVGNLKKPRNIITTVAAVLLVVVIGLYVKTAIKSFGKQQSSRPENTEL